MTAARRLLDDCFLHDKDRLRHDEVLALLKERLSPVANVEKVPLGDASERVLAEDVTAPRPVPAHTNAAVDGYAVAAASLESGSENRLPVTMRIAAGDPAAERLEKGTAARLFTGAKLPEGADTVIMQEDCETVETDVMIPAGVKRGINVRSAGEDVGQGGVVAQKGQRVTPQLLAAIASAGYGEVSCFRQLKVALVSSGDEVIRPGTPFRDGLVYDSNHFLLDALLQTVPTQVHDLGILPDDAAKVDEVIGTAAQTHDVILTTGGASRGEEDHMVELIASRGSLHAWQLAIKPGRPMAFGQLGNCVFLGLPGNPVAAFVCFLLYAQPMFAHLQGALWNPPQSFELPAGFSIQKKKPDRREFWRGWIEDGSLRKFERDGSGLISGLTTATGLIEIPEEVTHVDEGDLLKFIPFSSYGIKS
ncbi:MAG: molybdopterin molybdotransferase MoeA [Hyphomicrobiales bacterium]